MPTMKMQPSPMQSLLPAGFEERRGENRFIGAVELFHGVWIVGVGGSAQGLRPARAAKPSAGLPLRDSSRYSAEPAMIRSLSLAPVLPSRMSCSFCSASSGSRLMMASCCMAGLDPGVSARTCSRCSWALSKSPA
jgi:hypothetical protein